MVLCPAEEGIDTAKLYKEAKYRELSAAISDAGWSVELRSLEVGARGFVAHSVPRLLRDLGYSSREVSTLSLSRDGCCQVLLHGLPCLLRT